MSKDKIYFKNREEAAYKLLEILPIDSMRLEEWTVIACSYGGFEIAKIVADSLDAEFDIMFNEKIYAPQNDECEIAVVTELEEVLIHEELVKAFDINLDSIYIMSKEIYKDNIRPIAYRFRNGEKFQNLAGKNVLIVDEVINVGMNNGSIVFHACKCKSRALFSIAFYELNFDIGWWCWWFGFDFTSFQVGF